VLNGACAVGPSRSPPHRRHERARSPRRRRRASGRQAKARRDRVVSPHVAGPVRSVGLRRALARDPVVSRAGHRPQVQLVHLRDAARHLPLGLGAGSLAGPAGAGLAAAAAASALAGRHRSTPASRSPPDLAWPRDGVLRSYLAQPEALDLGEAVGRRSATSAASATWRPSPAGWPTSWRCSTARCRSSCSARHLDDGDELPLPAEGGPDGPRGLAGAWGGFRPRTSWARRGSDAHRHRAAALAGHGVDAPAADRPLRCLPGPLRHPASRRPFAAPRSAAALSGWTRVLASPGPRCSGRLHGPRRTRCSSSRTAPGCPAPGDRRSRPGPADDVFHVHGATRATFRSAATTPCSGRFPSRPPESVDVAVIGLGRGHRLRDGGAAETERIDCVEIVASELAALERRARRRDYPGLQRLLRDGRVATLHGRPDLPDAQRRRYDVIEADALWPDSAYSGNLYSLEYFRLLQRRLKPGATPSPGLPRRGCGHVRPVFPTWSGSGPRSSAATPRSLRPRRGEARALERFTRALRARRVDIVSLLSDALERPIERVAPGDDRSRLTDVTRLFPKDEYLASRSLRLR